MTDTKDQDRGAKISLSRPAGGRLELKKPAGDSGTVRQSFSHGRSKAVAVEVKKQRRPGAKLEAPGTAAPAGRSGKLTLKPGASSTAATAKQTARPAAGKPARRGDDGKKTMILKPLTEEEKAVRLRALSAAKKTEEEARVRAEENAKRAAEEAARRKAEEEAAAARKAEEDQRRQVEEEARRKAEEQAAKLLAEEEERKRLENEATGKEPAEAGAKAADGEVQTPADAEAKAEAVETKRSKKHTKPAAEDDEGSRNKRGKPAARTISKRQERLQRRRGGMDEDGDEEVHRRGKSRRKQDRNKAKDDGAAEFQVREVVLPEAITVQELAARMAVRGAEVVKVLMQNGIMATMTQTIDADTAEIVVEEMGHTVKRVAESDVEDVIEVIDDRPEDLLPRAPVVTVMGHVDHGKTSLLDCLRTSNVVAGEAGGITQHIGAYQVDLGRGMPVSFIDTPGHAAFTAMRARGAKVTDIVILVVAADDGVMPQTIEAIAHARAAEVPIIVAINKCDKPDANPDRIKNELLTHDVLLEDFGGEVQSVQISALKHTGIEELIDAVLLQAELLELKANPNRPAQGAVIEAELDRGRGVVATVLVQHGTLRQGDIVVCGAYWGRARALVNDHGKNIKEAPPSCPLELLGLDGVPTAGDNMAVVESERQAREITEYRQRKLREQERAALVSSRGSLEDIFSQIGEGGAKTLPIVIKADVHGSLEAIIAGLQKQSTDEVNVQVVHGGVGAITESDITLAVASKAAVVGFNVRANTQAREMAKRDGVEPRYYSIIYELLDDIKARMSGLLSPIAKEQITGHAEIRQVFSVSKVGKIAGCRVIDGIVRRHARARLLRDDVVIFEGALGSLRRHKDDVREVREGFECGMSIEGYNDIHEGDVIEAYEVEEVARTL